MKILRIFFLLALSGQAGSSLWGQENEAKPIENDIRISSGEKFDFIFSRAFLVPGSGIPSDSAPLIASTSGSYTLGVGLAIPIKKVVAIRIEPRFAWNNLNFQQTNDKTFPSDSNGHFLSGFYPADTGKKVIFERIRSFYGEVPIGIRFNLARNADDKVRLFTEVGFSTGLLFSSSLKVRKGTSTDRVTIKAHDVWGLNRLRYGPYFRFGTNWIAVQASYRLPAIFNENKRYLHPQSQTAVPFPLFPKVELGFAILL